jgi:ABC-type transport system involved in cytochrome c biogenesis permease subunit
MTAAATLGTLAVGAWLGAAGAYTRGRGGRPWADRLVLLGTVAGVLVLAWLWMALSRPPLRTLGETRWWYAVLTPSVALLWGWRFQTRAHVVPACLMGALFGGINLLRPDYMDRTLMPALQSGWFVPHVVVYMLAYATLGTASLLAFWLLLRPRFGGRPAEGADAELADRLVQIGFPLLTCGMLFGALWAKEAWGHYWAWDPKETWAFLTWCAYLSYLHVRYRHALAPRLGLGLLAGGFVVLLVCWLGVAYLPTVNESVHTYAQQ